MYKTPGSGPHNAPALPPRASYQGQAGGRLTPPPPAYQEAEKNSPYSSGGFATHDPRSSSTHSLVPEKARSHDQRTLLLIYIHGFMGNETSFQSFPAHVHNLVTVTLAESHVVHTKVYPRYKSRRTIDVAAEEFSRWLAPHESPKTDVILLGHSMGGLLAAEILLLPPVHSAPGQGYRHRILGAINFDVPFLGMHPGVISSGIASIFASKDDPASPVASADLESGLTSPSAASIDSQNTWETTSTGGPNRQDTLFNRPNDPNFNPQFNNDVILPMRKGWRNAMHFVNKHSDNLRQATKQYVKSHVEFGGAMADYPGLKARYTKVRALEDEDEATRKRVTQQARVPPRIRFINYYTASTGKPKKPKSPKSRSRSRSKSHSKSHSRSPSRARNSERGQSATVSGVQNQNMKVPEDQSSRKSRSRTPSPRISIEEHRDDGVHQMAHIHPEPEPSDPDESASDEEKLEKKKDARSDDEGSLNFDSDAGPKLSTQSTGLSLTESSVNDILPPHFHVQLPNLPPIPPPPTEPPALDLTPYPDKSAQKIVQKEHDRQVKIWKQAMKDCDSAIKDRAKLEAKMRKTAAKEILRKQKEEDKLKGKEDGDTIKKSKGKEKAKDFDPVDENTSPNEHTTKQSSHIQKSFTTESSGNTILSPPPSSSTTLTPTTTIDSTLSQSRSMSTGSPPSPSASVNTKDEKPPKKKKDRVFCMLPPKSSAGERDPAWVRVYMEGVDEVGAHCGLFIVSPTYERLVGDVGGRIEEWVREDMTRRFLAENGG
ncbi:hypothetical protein EJ08DRAFT_677850 [Tothia fuscella]|uniref:DUF676 domain-containing protein n=1 Tax=Tothia fuscella TaxID=1048955 RepID=A0A9P4NTM9_9PEZI|nr:hypothetical protein EJ08DRAFT_677850 [Tothia fuscella]